MDTRIQQLDGIWKIVRDPDNSGKSNKWYTGIPSEEAKDIRIPGMIQEAFPFYDGVAWYYYEFSLAIESIRNGRYLIDFTAVDYLCEVWLNGVYLGLHEDAEEPFQFDITDAVLPEGKNLLALRVVNPHEKPIDGITLEMTPRRNKFNLNHQPGMVLNYGGITGPVSILSVPAVSISDIYLVPNWKTGDVAFEITVRSSADRTEECEISVSIHEAAAGRHVLALRNKVLAESSQSVHTMTATVTGHRLWSTDDPFLYSACIRLTPASQPDAFTERTVRFGYRDFRVVNGFFMLNGKRIFLRSSHTGNNLPVGGFTSRNPDLYMRDLYYAKSMGFNMVRFIAGIPLADQLDVCDEIGLMVYEESYAGWLLGDSPRMNEYFDRSVSNMIRRDRNHPSVTIWGLLNETQDGNVFRAAVDFLPKARALDKTRLILLSSGRFDGDRSIGSLSNPWSNVWENEWGYDGSDEDVAVPEICLFKSTSDIHSYPSLPHTDAVKNAFRTLGMDGKPVFLSEYGIGSQNNIIQEYSKFAENGEHTDLEDASLYRSMMERMLADWEFYGLDGVFIFPEDFLVESMRLNCRQRQMTFDLVRSNPKICGYNLTGLLDHALTGEGLWTYWREFKPGMADTVREGWAPLRWALFSQKRCAYAGRPLQIEAVLCNEDVLAPGAYPAWFRIKGRDGIVWEKKTDIKLPKEGYAGLPPLAVSVLKENVCLEKPGEYEFGATLLDGGAPLGGRLPISILPPCAKAKTGRTVALWGCDEKTMGWLSEHGVPTVDFEREQADASLILVGKAGDAAHGGDLWKKLYDLAAVGATVIFLSPEALSDGEDTTARLPFAVKGKRVDYPRWLYHLDNIHIRHRVFDGIHDEGIVDYEYFDTIYPEVMFTGLEKPDKTICAAIGVGQAMPGGYASGVTLGEYTWGDGRIVLNCFRIIDSLGTNPIADQMLMNMIEYYS